MLDWWMFKTDKSVDKKTWKAIVFLPWISYVAY